MALAPVAHERAAAWAEGRRPDRHVAIRFRWRYRDERLTVVGRGAARIAPPDSLRFDYAAALDLASGAAALVGDSLLWADPPDQVRTLVPAVRMLWAALGTVRPPAPAARVFGREEPSRTIWRFVEDGDTLDYVASAPMPPGPATLAVEWRRGGDVVARSLTRYDAAGWPAGAAVDFPEVPARFELTVVAVDTAADVAPALWRSRH